MRYRSLAPLILVLVACSQRSTPPSPSASAAGVTPAPPSATHAAAEPGVFAKACAAPCSDEAAELTAYRDAAGAIAVVSVQGSPAACSHPPLRFFGSDGAERATIPLAAVAAGSPQARRAEDIRAEQTANLTKAETLHCRDVKH